MDIKEINSAIMFGNLTNDELNSIGDAIRYRRSQLTTQSRRSLSLGCTVKFTNSRTGQLLMQDLLAGECPQICWRRYDR
jgi:hypothetical protein